MIHITDKKNKFYFVIRLLEDYKVPYFMGDTMLAFRVLGRVIKIKIKDLDYDIYVDDDYYKSFATEWGVSEKFLRNVLERQKILLDKQKQT